MVRYRARNGGYSQNGAGAPLYTGACWINGWLPAAEKNSPSESYFLLLLLEYAQGDTYRRSLCSKNLKNQATEKVSARYFDFLRIDGSEQCGTQNNVQHCRAPCAVTPTAVVGGDAFASVLFSFGFPRRKGFHTLRFGCSGFVFVVLSFCHVSRPPRVCQIWLINLLRYMCSVQR